MSAMSEFKVGAFVITSVALILGGVVILGSGAIFKETETIETSTMESVNGLQIGSPVKFRGVPIGEVTVISFADRFYPENPLGETQFDYGSPVVIRMKVRIDVFGPEQSELFTKDLERGVIQGLRARLTSAGLTGGLFVELSVLDAETVPVVKLAFTPEFPYVPSAPNKLDQMLTSIETITESLSQVDFSSLGSSLQSTISSVDDTVKRRVDPLMVDADAFVDEVRESNRKLQAILTNPDINSFIANANSISADLNDALHPNTEGLRAALADLPLMMKSARDAADRLDKLVASDQVTRILANVDSAAGDLTPTLDQYRLLGAELTSFLESESYELRQLITALRQTSQNLEQLSERAKQDPSQLLFGQPPPKLAPGATAPSTPQ